MKPITYEQAHDWLVIAYMRDEIRPYDPSFCIAGNLNDHSDKWFNHYTGGGCHCHFTGIYYSGSELFRLEEALLEHLHKKLKTEQKYSTAIRYPSGKFKCDVMEHPRYEEELFNGVVKALRVLKQIHKERGDKFKRRPSVKKRVLVTA